MKRIRQSGHVSLTLSQAEGEGSPISQTFSLRRSFALLRNSTLINTIGVFYQQSFIISPFSFILHDMEGFLLIDKPAGMTSHDVVDVVRKATGEQRVGHAGTLDPFATGLLIVGVGRAATKHLGAVTKETVKTYEATLRLGATSESGDPEGPIIEREIERIPTKAEVRKVLDRFSGQQLQQPPALSAIKIHGTPAYKLARAGQSFVLQAREVEISALHLRKFTWPELEIEVTCSSGTYIRSLASDIGEALGCGAYLTALRRTAIGKWSVVQALELSQINERLESAMLGVSVLASTQK